MPRASNRLGQVINLEKTKVMVFRKGGHLAIRENWFVHGAQLDKVNSCTYIGYTVTTKPPIEKGLQNIVETMLTAGPGFKYE